MHKHASPETINLAIKLSTHRKVEFPGKFGPWGLKELQQLDTPLDRLHKHHLRFLPSTPNAALHMATDVGGIGFTKLSDQINIDKWVVLNRGLYSGYHTARDVQSLLQRSLRIGRSDTDIGYEAIARPISNTQLLPVPITTRLHKKLMNYRKTTLADLMRFETTGNIWDPDNGTAFPSIVPFLPPCPTGDRLLRVGQFWAVLTNEGPK